MKPDKILVVDNKGSIYGRAVDGLGEITADTDYFFEHPEDFQLVLFTGGADVSPALYNDSSPRRLCYTNPARDDREVAIFNHAKANGIRMTGICRGSQLINVLSGGRMMHDIMHHSGPDHMMATNDSEEAFQVTSTHHQMSVLSEDGLLIGWSEERRSGVYIGAQDFEEEYTGPEVEAFVYPETLCFGVQYHPEYMHKECAGYNWYWQAVKDFLELSMDAFVSKYARQKDEFAEVSA